MARGGPAAGGGPPGGPPNLPSGAGAEGSDRRRWWLALGTGVLLVIAVVAVVLVRDGGGGEVLTVRLVAAADPGASPFTADVSTVSDADADTVRSVGAGLLPSSPPGSGGLQVQALAADAEAPAYGAAAEPVCDVEALSAALEADPAALAAWAELMGIDADVESAAAALGGLTPLVLAHDTAVTNSAYDEGTARTFQAILQAGTAVLVDGSGTPRVKCSCGNPLLPAAITGSVKLEGDPWDGFDERSVVAIGVVDGSGGSVPAIDAATGEVGEVDLREDRGEVDTVEVDTVELDGYLVDDADGVYVSDAEGDRTKVLDGAVAAVFDDGAGGLIFQRQRTTSGDLYERRETSEPAPADAEAATIWHLPAGAVDPVPLLGSDDPATHWFSLQDVEVGAGGTKVAYYELADPYACPGFDGCVAYERQEAAILDLDSGEVEVLPEAFFGRQSSPLRLGAVIVGAGESDDAFGELNLMAPDGTVTREVCDCAYGFAAVIDADRFLTIWSYDGVTYEVCRFDDLEGCGTREEILAVTGDNEGGVTTASLDGERLLVSSVFAANTDAIVWEVDLAAGAEQSAVLPTKGRTAFLHAPLIRPQVDDAGSRATSCGSVATHDGSPAPVVVLSGTTSCDEAVRIWTTYFDPGTIVEGSSAFADVDGWTCHVDTIVAEDGTVGTCELGHDAIGLLPPDG